MKEAREILLSRGGIIIDGVKFDRKVLSIHYSANKDYDFIYLECYVEDEILWRFPENQ